MDPFPICKVPKPPNAVLFTPPPYCKIFEKRDIKHEEAIPSLELIASNPAKLLHLWEKLADDSSKSLEMTINNYLAKEANCKSVFLIRISIPSEEAIIQVLGTEDLGIPLRLPMDESVIRQLVQYENEILKCDDCLHSQIVEAFKAIYPASRHEFITIPIIKKNSKFYSCNIEDVHPEFLVCFVDSQKNESFLIKLANEVFRYCQPILLNTIFGEEEGRRRRLWQLLSQAGRNLFSNLENVKDLLKTIQSEGKRLTFARKCSIFLVNSDHVQFIANDFSSESKNQPTGVKIRLVEEQEIAAHVARTGQLVNLRNSNQNVDFSDRNVNEILDHPTKSLLCFPFRTEDQIVGVAQLFNKDNGNFDEFDEELIKVYGFYCGVILTKALNYKYVNETGMRSNISNCLLTHYIKANDDDVAKVKTCPFIHLYPEMSQFSFSPHIIAEREITCFILQMFENLGFINTFSMKRESIIRFIIMLKKCHSDIPYHNWEHTLTVTHFAYVTLIKLRLEEKHISSLEMLAYFISCLCHNVDHRGDNNPFQQHSHGAVAALYSSPGSTTLRHQLSQTLSILNTEGCNFLESLQRKDYTLCLDLIKDMILATDLATHIKFYKKQYDMVQDGYDSQNPEHRYILMSVLMVCAELSEQLKDWPFVKHVTENIYKEYFLLGDIVTEKEDKLIEMKDRETVNIADMQIDFLRNICLSAYKILVNIFPDLKELVSKIKRNILCWESSRHIFQRDLDAGISNIDVLEKSEEFELNVEAVITLLEKAEKGKKKTG